MEHTEEILLKENKDRFVILPINYPKNPVPPVIKNVPFLAFSQESLVFSNIKFRSSLKNANIYFMDLFIRF